MLGNKTFFGKFILGASRDNILNADYGEKVFWDLQLREHDATYDANNVIARGRDNFKDIQDIFPIYFPRKNN
ncbi:hypothetical protein M8J75_014550 [Diaphorina citri]|nr:hypothetical protein M8J75_014550 [Diaphorina citri]